MPFDVIGFDSVRSGPVRSVWFGLVSTIRSSPAAQQASANGRKICALWTTLFTPPPLYTAGLPTACRLIYPCRAHVGNGISRDYCTDGNKVGRSPRAAAGKSNAEQMCGRRTRTLLEARLPSNIKTTPVTRHPTHTSGSTTTAPPYHQLQYSSSNRTTAGLPTDLVIPGERLRLHRPQTPDLPFERRQGVAADEVLAGRLSTAALALPPIPVSEAIVNTITITTAVAVVPNGFARGRVSCIKKGGLV